MAAHSCGCATETLEWINAIHQFLRPYAHILNAHVVNFFKDRLWETLDQQWVDCLGQESVENLLKIPSGIVQDYWPSSLKDFVLTLKSLVLPREQGDLNMAFPDLHVTSIGSVLAQGMNQKKKHEVEILSAIISSVARSVGAQRIIDVGAGQGYLAQVLSFQYQLSVVAIDASSHHGAVTSTRAKRIEKHYSAKLRELQTGSKHLNVPQTITCHVLSSEVLKSLSDTLCHKGSVDQSNGTEIGSNITSPGLVSNLGTQSSSCNSPNMASSLVLAGLHACGDLSVTMLRSFVECEEVKAVVSIGCCYNLLTEECSEKNNCLCGFPTSDGVKHAGLSLGKNARDLACQSAERWRSLTEVDALQNFELHAFRAAFQSMLHKYYPEISSRSPSIGRQGKALRRQKLKRDIQAHLQVTDGTCHPSGACQGCSRMGTCSTMNVAKGRACSILGADTEFHDTASNHSSRIEDTSSPDRYPLFENFCKSGLCRLGLVPMEGMDILESWREVEPEAELIGPYWSLRAALGSLVETLLLLDRLLFLQEQGDSVEAVILPLFNPVLSPRNVALIARKK